MSPKRRRTPRKAATKKITVTVTHRGVGSVNIAAYGGISRRVEGLPSDGQLRGDLGIPTRRDLATMNADFGVNLDGLAADLGIEPTKRRRRRR